jgi:hypothetical protein
VANKQQLGEQILLLLKQEVEPKEAVEVLLSVLVTIHMLQATDKSLNGLFAVLREALPPAFVEKN